MNMRNILLVGGAVSATIIAGIAMGVTIKGSDTLLILNQRWAEAYGKKTGGSVNVTGGGSSIGLKAFTNGSTDIAAASRKMKKSEVDKAKTAGAIANEIPVALDGLAIIVNKSNPVQSLDLDQLRRIYIGEFTNWSQVGGPSQPIVVYSRNQNSGTYGFFQEVVLKLQNWGKGVRFMGSTAEEVIEVQKTPGGIAYGGVAYFQNKANTKIIPIAPKKGAAPLMPSEENVRSKKYPIWRYLYYYTNGKPKGGVKSFIDFVLSSEGQKIVEQVGYYSVK